MAHSAARIVAAPSLDHGAHLAARLEILPREEDVDLLAADLGEVAEELPPEAVELLGLAVAIEAPAPEVLQRHHRRDPGPRSAASPSGCGARSRTCRARGRPRRSRPASPRRCGRSCRRWGDPSQTAARPSPVLLTRNTASRSASSGEREAERRVDADHAALLLEKHGQQLLEAGAAPGGRERVGAAEQEHAAADLGDVAGERVLLPSDSKPSRRGPASTTTRNGASSAGVVGGARRRTRRGSSTPWRNTERSEVRLTPVSFSTESSASERWMNLKSQVSAPWTKRSRISSSRATRTSRVRLAPEHDRRARHRPPRCERCTGALPSFSSSMRSKSSAQECQPVRCATRRWSTRRPSRKRRRSKAGTSPEATARIRVESE